MKFFSKGKDGGPESTVTGYWLVEAKRLFSAALLRFDDGTRDAYHSHAFDSVSWVLRGRLIERFLDGGVEVHEAGVKPVITRRRHFHRVESEGTTWVLTFRGPWAKRWCEYLPQTDEFVTLTHGRQRVEH